MRYKRITGELTHVKAGSLSELGITVSIALVGTMAGALTAGTLGQRFGSREMLRLTAVLYVAFSSGMHSSFPSLFRYNVVRYSGSSMFLMTGQSDRRSLLKLAPIAVCEYIDLVRAYSVGADAGFPARPEPCSMSACGDRPGLPEPQPAFRLKDNHRADSLGITSSLQPNFELRNVTDCALLGLALQGIPRCLSDQSNSNKRHECKREGFLRL